MYRHSPHKRRKSFQVQAGSGPMVPALGCQSLGSGLPSWFQTGPGRRGVQTEQDVRSPLRTRVFMDGFRGRWAHREGEDGLVMALALALLRQSSSSRAEAVKRIVANPSQNLGGCCQCRCVRTRPGFLPVLCVYSSDCTLNIHGWCQDVFSARGLCGCFCGALLRENGCY